MSSRSRPTRRSYARLGLLASLTLARAAAVDVGGASSVRKSINFGPVLEIAHHSLDRPSAALSSFNSAESLIADGCAALDYDCSGRARALAFVAALHPDAAYQLVDGYLSKGSGTFHAHLLRTVDGLPVVNANLNVNVDVLTGEVVSYGDSTVAPGWKAAVQSWAGEAKQIVFGAEDVLEQYSTPPLVPAPRATDPRHGLLSFLALSSPTLDLSELLLTTRRAALVDLMQVTGPTTAVTIDNVPSALVPVPATLVYVQDAEGALKLSWKYEVLTADNQYEAYVSADAAGVAGDEEVLMCIDWVRDFRPSGGEVGFEALALHAGNVQKFRLSSKTTKAALPVPPRPSAPVAKGVYRVLPWGTNDPSEGGRSTLKGAGVELDWEASPAGWHTVPATFIGGKETIYTTTQGNNVIAQENWEGQQAYVNNYRPDAGAALKFDYPIHMPKEGTPLDPRTYINASVSQLFYTVNEAHDLFYRYGFDEAAANFQEFNFGRGGLGGDAVQANAQDGSGVNNANFATPPDGQRPRMRMFYWNQQQPYRDGSMESGIVLHEFSHGISTRMTGGGANSGCLGWGEAGGMGEGWGDFFATMIRQHSANETEFAMGEWASGRVGGIRNYRYSTNMTVNLDTYKTLDKPGYWGVHAIGEVWAEMLFEMAENLIGEHGFESTLFPPAANTTSTFYNDKYTRLVPKSGNTLAMQLVVDGLKMQPCRPAFTDARDAILTADKVLTQGDNACLIWKAFAKRGLGPKASVFGGTPWGGGQHKEDYSLPAVCLGKK